MALAPPSRRKVRDRHDRGPRGPVIAPVIAPVIDPVTVAPVRIRWPGPRERFDDLVLGTVSQVEARLTPGQVERLGLVEYAVEDAPMVPADWAGHQVPLSALIRGSGTVASQLVIFRRPIEHRANSRGELVALVHLVLVEQLAELLETTPEHIDPRYEQD